MKFKITTSKPIWLATQPMIDQLEANLATFVAITATHSLRHECSSFSIDLHHLDPIMLIYISHSVAGCMITRYNRIHVRTLASGVPGCTQDSLNLSCVRTPCWSRINENKLALIFAQSANYSATKNLVANDNTHANRHDIQSAIIIFNSVIEPYKAVQFAKNFRWC